MDSCLSWSQIVWINCQYFLASWLSTNLVNYTWLVEVCYVEENNFQCCLTNQKYILEYFIPLKIKISSKACNNYYVQEELILF